LANNFYTVSKVVYKDGNIDGYIVEAAVYAKTIKFSNGLIIGFDVQVNDADNSGKRVNVLTWSDPVGNDYKDTSRFGCLELIEEVTPSNNANLSGLTLSAGVLTPTFQPNVTNYSVNVTNDISSITVTPTTEDNNATIKVNNQDVINGQSSQPINLNIGSNAITITVTAQDNSTKKTYTINVKRAMVAIFGSPVVDGEIDDIWNNVPEVMPMVVSASTTTNAKFKTLWDDNALYILAVVDDAYLDSRNSATYQQDSVEIFMDESNDKALSYKSDDVHYRVNYNNFRSADNGDINRFYTKTKITSTGYIVEARIALNDKPNNGKVLGFELQINEANGGSRKATLNVFDTTGNAYQNPSLMGELILTAKKEGDTTGVNPYDLLAYLDYVKSIDKTVYLNGNILDAPIAAAEAVLAKQNKTQSEIDNALNNLKMAVSALRRSEKYAEPGTLPTIQGLPDPFTFMNGTKVTTRAQWEKRAAELKDMYQFYMYGYMPDTSKEIVTYEKTQTGMNIKVKVGDKEAIFAATVNLPPSDCAIKGPYPVIVSIGPLWTYYVAQANARGYAVISFTPTAVASDSYARTGAFFTLYPYSQAKNDVGVLMAWAWGAGKVLDVLKQNAYPEIDPNQAIITGFSRWGKAALVTGAFDNRFAIVNPHCSGAGGMASFRYSFAGKQYSWGTAGASEGIGNLQGSTEGHWFSSVFGGFKDVNTLPFDQHELAALCAPRALLITGGYSDWWTNPEGMYVSYVGASKVYDFLGASDKIGFAFRDGTHGITQEDIDNLLDFCDLQLRGIQKEGKDFKTTRFTPDSSWDTIIAPQLKRNANLKSLQISAGTLSPSFNTNVTNYNISVGNNISSVSIIPVTEDANATVTINGKVVNSGQLSQPIILNTGSNIIKVTVTADDNSVKTYTINIYRDTADTINNIITPQTTTTTTTTPTKQEQTTQQPEKKETPQVEQKQEITPDLSKGITKAVAPDKQNTIDIPKIAQIMIPDNSLGSSGIIMVKEVQNDTVKTLNSVSKPIEITTTAKIKGNIEIKFEIDKSKLAQDKVPVVMKLTKNGWQIARTKVDSSGNVSAITTEGGKYVVVADSIDNIFKDMKDHWAKDAAKDLLTKGIMVGFTDKTFRPDEKVNMSETLVMLSRALNWTPPAEQDQKAEKLPVWAKDALINALNSGVISEDMLSNPTRKLSRLETIEIIVKAAEKLLPTVDKKAINFTDMDKIPSDKLEYVEKAVALNLINGYSDGSFKPNDPISRAEAGIIISKLLSSIQNSLK